MITTPIPAFIHIMNKRAGEKSSRQLKVTICGCDNVKSSNQINMDEASEKEDLR